MAKKRSQPTASETRSSGLVTSRPADDRPPPKFELRQPVAVPDTVHASKSATIAGYEFGGKKSAGWMYYLAFAEGGQAWEASEEELLKWQQ